MKKLTTLFCLILLFVPGLKSQVPLRGVPEDFCEPGKEMDLFQNFENPSIDDHLRMLLLPGMQPGSSDLENAEAKIKGFWAELEPHVEENGFSKKGEKLISQFEREILFKTPLDSGSLGTAVRFGGYSETTPICFRVITFERFQIPFNLSIMADKISFSCYKKEWNLSLKPKNLEMDPNSALDNILPNAIGLLERLPSKEEEMTHWKRQSGLYANQELKISHLAGIQWCLQGLSSYQLNGPSWRVRDHFEKAEFLFPTTFHKLLITNPIISLSVKEETSPVTAFNVYFRLYDLWDAIELIDAIFIWFDEYLDTRIQERTNPNLLRTEKDNLIKQIGSEESFPFQQKLISGIQLNFYSRISLSLMEIDVSESLNWLREGISLDFDSSGTLYKMAMANFVLKMKKHPSLNELEDIFYDIDDFCDSIPGCLSDSNLVKAKVLTSGAIAEYYFEQDRIKMGKSWLTDYATWIGKLNFRAEEEPFLAMPYKKWLYACIREQDGKQALKAAEEGLKLFPNAEKLKSLREQLDVY